MAHDPDRARPFRSRAARGVRRGATSVADIVQGRRPVLHRAREKRRGAAGHVAGPLAPPASRGAAGRCPRGRVARQSRGRPHGRRAARGAVCAARAHARSALAVHAGTRTRPRDRLRAARRARLRTEDAAPSLARAHERGGRGVRARRAALRELGRAPQGRAAGEHRGRSSCGAGERAPRRGACFPLASHAGRQVVARAVARVVELRAIAGQVSVRDGACSKRSVRAR
jgi:hypothetical protein